MQPIPQQPDVRRLIEHIRRLINYKLQCIRMDRLREAAEYDDEITYLASKIGW